MTLTDTGTGGEEPMVEAAAKALVQFDIDNPEHPDWKQLQWADLTGWEREEWRKMARVALEAAAAPDLLEALKAIADLKGWNEKPPISATGIQAMAAISKATGAAP